MSADLGQTELRAGAVEDAERLARMVIDGFEVYRAFAPPDWEPPPVDDEVALLQELLADETTWCLLAESDGRVAGQITFVPAARAAVAAARERGYVQMRLFTPAEHGRARRFYEREGWVQVGEEFHAPGPDLVLVEYRYALAG